MFESVCSFPLSADLFAQAIHPNEPIIAVGLASGHVQTLRLPALANGNSAASEDSHSGTSSSSGQGTIDTLWQTHRHKGSCRSLAFSTDGSQLVSTGTDGVVKIASTETGQVARKLAVPAERHVLQSSSAYHGSVLISNSGELVGSPALLHVLSPETLILATDHSAVHLYDIRANAGSKGLRPQQTHHPHDDYVSSLTPLPPSETSTSGYSKQWVTTGGSTLAVTDLRRGVLVKSEDQEEELLSSTIIRGLGKRGTSVGEKVVVGGAGGVLTLWEKGIWDDQDERIVVDAGKGGGESLDVLTTVPKGVGTGREVLVGLGDGRIKVVRLGQNRVIADLRHDEIEGVVALGFDAEGRAISGGGQILKVWQEKWDEEDGEEHGSLKRDRESDTGGESSDDEVEVETEEEEEGEKDRKKQKLGNGTRDGRGDHGVLAFKGLD